MRFKTWCSWVLACAFFLSASAHVRAQAWRGAAVANVLDGDTVDVIFNQQTVRLRLANIDAPEIYHGPAEPGQPFGQRAKVVLIALLATGTVDVFPISVDHYGRVIATVYANGQNVNTAMVRRGMAWVYTHYNTDPILPPLEATARRLRIGLWADPDPVPPWDYRHRIEKAMD